MENNICKNCVHWKDYKHVLQGYDERYRVCDNAYEKESNGLVDTICFSEGIGGELVTREDFGCVMFKSRI